MTTWQKMLAVLVSVIFGGIVAYICIKPNIDNFEITKNEETKSDVFEQYIGGNEKSESENTTNTNATETDQEKKKIPDEEEKETTLTDKEYNEIEVKGTDEEKAIALAKNKWRADNDDVYFNISRREGNIFYISVNDKRTTEVLNWYKIDISSGEVSDF